MYADRCRGIICAVFRKKIYPRSQVIHNEVYISIIFGSSTLGIALSDEPENSGSNQLRRQSVAGSSNSWLALRLGKKKSYIVGKVVNLIKSWETLYLQLYRYQRIKNRLTA